MTTFRHLLDLLGTIPDPRRAQGKLYTLPYRLLFAILAVVAGAPSYRGIHSFIDVHLDRLKAAFSLRWQVALAHPLSSLTSMVWPLTCMRPAAEKHRSAPCCPPPAGSRATGTAVATSARPDGAASRACVPHQHEAVLDRSHPPRRGQARACGDQG